MIVWTTATTTEYKLRDAFFNMTNYLQNNGDGMEHIINGLIQQAALRFDPSVHEDLTHHLFQDLENGFKVSSHERNRNKVKTLLQVTYF